MSAEAPVRAITAEALTAESFAPYGRIVAFDGSAPELVRTAGSVGSDWTDAYDERPITRETPSLGMTSAPGAPFVSTVMERHANVEEALLPAGRAIVLAVAEASAATAPAADDVRAFLIPPGAAVVLTPGTWHDACRGVDGPTSYYWLASCVDSGSSPWTPLAGGPVGVGVAA